MKRIFEILWRKNTGCFSIYNYRHAWKKAGVRPAVRFRTNGATRRSGDRCLDVSLTLGYTIIGYTNYDLQRSCATKGRG